MNSDCVFHEAPEIAAAYLKATVSSLRLGTADSAVIMM